MNSKGTLRELAEYILENQEEELNKTKNKKEYNPDVERTGDKIIVPDGADLDKVIIALQRKNKAEQQTMDIHVTIPVPPWDGAIALVRAIESELGVLIQNENFWARGATSIEVEVDLGMTLTVPWGEFVLPTMDDAIVETGTHFENNRIMFSCNVHCKRRFEKRVRTLLDKVRILATTQSLHKGKAFSIAFKDSNGRPELLPKPRFFAMNGEVPIFNKDLELAIERNIFVPLQQSAHLLQIGEPLKRGALFAGPYGVGKTMLAHYIASVAIKAGWTFIYVKDPDGNTVELRYY